MRPSVPASRSLFDLAPLRRFWWWAALGLLVVNDNLLKGQGLVPGWLTGKLSDFAFLIVAPVLTAVVLPVAMRGRRVVALGAIAGIYTAADLSSEFSDAVVAAAAGVGLRWRLWPDWTDLVALVVLPLAWRLIGAAVLPRGNASCRSARGPLVARGLERAGLVLGAAACLATSGPITVTHHPFLVNRTESSATVTLTWLLRKVPCGADLAALGASLNPGDLDVPRPVSLASGQVVALDLQPASGQPLAGTCSNGPEPGHWAATDCAAVLASAGEQASVLAVAARTRESESGSPCRPMLSPTANPGPDALSLIHSDGRLRFVAGANLRVVEVSAAAIAGRPVDPEGCQSLLAEERAIREAASACTMDSDCQRLEALPVVNGACEIYVNQGAPLAALQTLHQRWGQTCASDPLDSNCRLLRPAICRGGVCQEACPGVSLGACPPRCDQSRLGMLTPGEACPTFVGPCAASDGSWCDCRTGKFSCAPPIPAPGCPLLCLESRPSAGGAGATGDNR